MPKKSLISKAREFFRTIRSSPVSAKALGFSYKEQEVLKSISLNVKKGKITAIIGKSGSGKSTFLKLISGIISFGSSGDVRIFGKPRMLEKDSIGFVSQELAFIPDLPIKDNIRICGLNSGIKESEALERADELMRLLRLDENLNKKPTELSGGQKVRLHIILSLLHDPKIIVLDEPFVGLDFLNRRWLWHFIELMKTKKKSVIITSHLL
jgi:ABC-2 type transport system ATP-binding protein